MYKDYSGESIFWSRNRRVELITCHTYSRSVVEICDGHVNKQSGWVQFLSVCWQKAHMSVAWGRDRKLASIAFFCCCYHVKRFGFQSVNRPAHDACLVMHHWSIKSYLTRRKELCAKNKVPTALWMATSAKQRQTCGIGIFFLLSFVFNKYTTKQFNFFNF